MNSVEKRAFIQGFYAGLADELEKQGASKASEAFRRIGKRLSQSAEATVRAPKPKFLSAKVDTPQRAAASYYLKGRDAAREVDKAYRFAKNPRRVKVYTKKQIQQRKNLIDFIKRRKQRSVRGAVPGMIGSEIERAGKVLKGGTWAAAVPVAAATPVPGMMELTYAAGKAPELALKQVGKQVRKRGLVHLPPEPKKPLLQKFKGQKA